MTPPKGYGLAADMFSLGVTLYTMHEANFPFSPSEDCGEASAEVSKLIKGGVNLDAARKAVDTMLLKRAIIGEHPRCARSPHLNFGTLAANCIITGMLRKKPADRLISTKALEHEWFAPVRDCRLHD